MKRKKPMVRSGSLRTSPLKKRTALKPKRVPVSLQHTRRPRRLGWVKGRYRAGRDEWERIRQIKLGPCRCCGATTGISLHHVVERDDFGDDVPENVIPLCGSGTTGCHGVYTQKRNGRSHDGIRRSYAEVCNTIRLGFTDDEILYVLERKTSWYPASNAYAEHGVSGWKGGNRLDFLNKRYPLAA